MTKITVLNFYSFCNLVNLEEIMPKILLLGRKKSIKGTIILAQEGFNGGVSGEYENVFLLLELLAKISNIKLEAINYKINYCDYHPFDKLKVKVKSEIVQMGCSNIDVNKHKGQYLDAAEWDDFIQQKDVIAVDTRNDYEVELGTFANSINPKTATFKEFPKWADAQMDTLKGKKIAMFCTGGIRCEKSTSYLKMLGAQEVYHLKGGILQYLEDTQNKNNLWQGECFVFDNRMAVDDNLAPSKDNNAGDFKN
jgi:UPF0176 protein